MRDTKSHNILFSVYHSSFIFLLFSLADLVIIIQLGWSNSKSKLQLHSIYTTQNIIMMLFW